jgi:hypothetical protein
MKKMLALCLCFVVYSAVKAQDTSTTTTTTTTTHAAKQMQFYYYPSSNVYYDPTSKNYWYWDNTGSQWTSVTELPSTIQLEKTNRVIVYHNGTDVWKDNTTHLKKYKTKKDGTVKVKGNG